MKTLRYLAPIVSAAVLAATACGAAGSRPAGSAPAPSTSATVAARPASSAAAPGSVRKLVVFVVENHSLGEMRRDMPYVSSLARRYGYASRYNAQTHPSLPNYLAMVGGSTFGVHDDGPPSEHPISGRSVFGEAIRAGRTAKVYADSMPGACRTQPAGRYAVKHNAWAYFRDERSLCRKHDVPLRALARDVRRGHLPTIGAVIPNLCHDAHDCALGTADRWLRRHVGQLLRGRDWRSGHLAVVITADEDDDHHGNRILTVVADPALHHRVVAKRLDHYSLSRSYANVAGVRPLRHAARARPLLQAFGLRAG